MTVEYNETKLFGIMFFIWRTQEISEYRGEKTVLRNRDFVTEWEIRAFISYWLEWSKRLETGGACNSTLDHWNNCITALELVILTSSPRAITRVFLIWGFSKEITNDKFEGRILVFHLIHFKWWIINQYIQSIHHLNRRIQSRASWSFLYCILCQSVEIWRNLDCGILTEVV